LTTKSEENIARENDQKSERPGRIIDDGDNLVVYKNSQLRICVAMYIDISII